MGNAISDCKQSCNTRRIVCGADMVSAEMIIVRAYEYELIFQHRVRAGQNTNDIGPDVDRLSVSDFVGPRTQAAGPESRFNVLPRETRTVGQGFAAVERFRGKVVDMIAKSGLVTARA